MKADLIRVRISKIEDWYTATSESLPGLFLTDSSYDALFRIIPEGIAHLIKVKDRRNVRVEAISTANAKTDAGAVDFIAKAA